jgi:hypothetical protein
MALKVSTGKVNIAVNPKKGYAPKQNARDTSRSIRGNRDRQKDFNTGAQHGTSVRGSGNMYTCVNVDG